MKCDGEFSAALRSVQGNGLFHANLLVLHSVEQLNILPRFFRHPEKFLPKSLTHILLKPHFSYFLITHCYWFLERFTIGR